MALVSSRNCILCPRIYLTLRLQHIHDASGSSLQRNASKRSVSLSFIERRLSRLTISRRGSESPEDIRGPLGLNLLYEPSEPRIEFVFVRLSPESTDLRQKH